ncbi:MAG: hypothetical protein RBR06_05970 [Desulfuromonadaceae bacterium]|nr:hypothetical protein [Desulfuromonadaceae bacterium]
MKRKALAVSALVGALSLSSGVTLAADQALAQVITQTQNQEQIYGSQLMTQQERTEYNDKMRSAKTAGEQEQIRAENHELMQERAKDRGVTLSADPPAKGGGMGPGKTSGGRGMGPGGGRR